MSTCRTKLYVNGGDEDVTAVRLLSRAQIPYVDLGPIEGEKTPFLEYGYLRFQGIQGIQEFIGQWCNKSLPPLDLFRER